jgi:mRNA-degrading endonuclease RelE of RelBE toxin-antitoxin system
MKIDYLPSALRALEELPVSIRKAFFKQVTFLVNNLHHPSLHAKKYDESRELWQARVNDDWRSYFHIVRDTYLVRDIIPHPKRRRR